MAVNQERVAAGLRPLTVAADLVRVARIHSIAMAQQQNVFHNPDLPRQVFRWLALGENVGDGDNVERIHQDFMGSPTHRRNVLYGPDTIIGVGVTWTNGQLFVTEIFAQRLPSASQGLTGTAAAWRAMASTEPALLEIPPSGFAADVPEDPLPADVPADAPPMGVSKTPTGPREARSILATGASCPS